MKAEVITIELVNPKQSKYKLMMLISKKIRYSKFHHSRKLSYLRSNERYPYKLEIMKDRLEFIFLNSATKEHYKIVAELLELLIEKIKAEKIIVTKNETTTEYKTKRDSK